MKNTKYYNIKFGIVFGILSLFVMFILMLIRFGSDELFYNAEHRVILQYFLPLWAIGLEYSGYGFSKYFQTLKKMYLEIILKKQILQNQQNG